MMKRRFTHSLVYVAIFLWFAIMIVAVIDLSFDFVSFVSGGGNWPSSVFLSGLGLYLFWTVCRYQAQKPDQFEEWYEREYGQEPGI